MPLVSFSHIGKDSLLGLWHLEESAGELAEYIPFAQKVVDGIKSEARKQERLAAHRLLHLMTGDHQLLITHQPNGKPCVKDYFISISHTKGYVVVMLSCSGVTGVDIEQLSDRVTKIARRFLRPDEFVEDWKGQLICWSAKETVYKFFSEEELAFSDMRILPFQVAAHGLLTVQNLKSAQEVNVSYRLNEEFVLTMVTGKALRP